MCALFGFLDYGQNVPLRVLQKLLQALANASEVRGNHASGIAYVKDGNLTIYKRPKPAHKMHFRLPPGTKAVMGHTRFTTQGSEKCNFNNHPFRGYAGTDFALAHNGVLYNDKELRITESLPITPIETDSYIAVQLLEKFGSLDFDSLRKTAELVRGGFTFTLLDQEGNLYFIKGESPLHLIHFPSLGLYVYASTAAIMQEALEKSPLLCIEHQVINITEGDILKISSNGTVSTASFQMPTYMLPRRAWFSASMHEADEDDAFEELLELCGYFGLCEEDVIYLRECGYSYDEIEEFMWNPRLFEQEIMCEEL